ncbi:hypothetical protein [Rickettsiella endosymbiont of Rhagonycha lignosa]|uniref:hypothetical protein n=1 Tax=Rickettsiella endosymbiont of Rhagonycha lignosa TaxID=3077937 RepID=UPI00313C6FCD
MSCTVTEIITKAWNLSGIVAAQAETVSGDQLSDGLEHLNDFLALQNANARMIPYTRVQQLTCVAHSEELFVQHLLSLDSLTLSEEKPSCYLLQSLPLLGRKQYFNQDSSLFLRPRFYHLEKTKGGSLLFLSPTPDKTYSLKLVGKFGLTEVNPNDDLSAIFDRDYLLYLRYGLADYLCDLYNHPFSAKGKLKEIERKLLDASPLDLSMEKIFMFHSKTV